MLGQGILLPLEVPIKSSPLHSMHLEPYEKALFYFILFFLSLWWLNTGTGFPERVGGLHPCGTQNPMRCCPGRLALSHPT